MSALDAGGVLAVRRRRQKISTFPGGNVKPTRTPARRRTTCVVQLLASIVAVLAGVPEPPTTAPPNPEVLELHWRAPPGCPTKEDLERRIRALLPAEPSGEGVLVVEGDVTTSDSGAILVLRSTFDGRSETREITARACGELLESTAVLLAVALEPSATIASRREPDPEPSTDTPASDPLVEIAESATEDRDRPATRRTGSADRPTDARASRIGVALRIAVGIEAGAVPPPSAALSGAVSILWRRARLEAHGTWLAPRTVRVADGRGATYQLGAFGVRGCGRVFARAIELPLCAGAEAGALRVRPRGIDAVVANEPWAAAVASVGLVRAWGPIGIVATVDGIVRLVGNRIEIGDAVSLRQFPVSVRASLGIELPSLPIAW
jgi:hypothetical protein